MRIYIGHPREETLKVVKAMIAALEHEVVGSTSLAKQMVKDCKALNPELIISGVDYEDMDGLDALIKISEGNPKPSIVIAQKADLDRVERAMDDHVMAYLVDPISRDDLRPTIYVVKRRFEQFEELKRENDDLREALTVRKLVERAKGILMRRHDLSEEDAYLRLRSMATSKRMKLRALAELVIELENA